MARYVAKQLSSDDPGDGTSITLTEYTGAPQSECGLEPGTYRFGFLDWQEPVEVPVVNLLKNTPFAGTVAGTPGTKPDWWERFLVEPTDMEFTIADEELTFIATDTFGNVYKQIVGAANTTYFFSAEAEVLSGSLFASDILTIFNLPTGAVINHFVDGEAADGFDSVPAGLITLAARIVIGETSGTPQYQFGVGMNGVNRTASVMLRKPQLEVGTARSTYQRIVATS